MLTELHPAAWSGTRVRPAVGPEPCCWRRCTRRGIIERIGSRNARYRWLWSNCAASHVRTQGKGGQQGLTTRLSPRSPWPRTSRSSTQWLTSAPRYDRGRFNSTTAWCAAPVHTGRRHSGDLPMRGSGDRERRRDPKHREQCGHCCEYVDHPAGERTVAGRHPRPGQPTHAHRSGCHGLVNG